MRSYLVGLACAVSLLTQSIQYAPRAAAEQIKMDVALAHPAMLITDKEKRENHLLVSLTGFEMANSQKRAPVNIAIVIDRSGSMSGEKIVRAREAAIQAVERLRDDDIVSIVTYDSSVDVLVPATKASDREIIKERIRGITPKGNTSLFAGVSKGAAEVRKFLDVKRVNRVILLSDGLANVGPSSPSELGQLGRSLIKEGISVSTMGLGLGYNEDLMSKLALESSGNHTFIEDAQNLVEVFQREFDDVLNVVAQRIQIVATLDEGIRPVKVLNNAASIHGQTVSIDLGQLYARQERYFVIEIEVPHGKNNERREVAKVTAEYRNVITDTTDKLSSSVEVKFTDSPKVAEESINKSVLTNCVIQIANERNREATIRRDQGDIQGAESLLLDNALYLDSYYKRTGDDSLQRRAAMNAQQSKDISAPDWNRGRKKMVEGQVLDSLQQSYSGAGAPSSPTNR